MLVLYLTTIKIVTVVFNGTAVLSNPLPELKSNAGNELIVDIVGPVPFGVR